MKECINEPKVIEVDKENGFVATVRYNTDSKQIFLNFYSNIVSDATFTIQKEELKIIEYLGNPNIVLRLGKSEFGEQMIFEYKVVKNQKEYKSASTNPFEKLEYYLPKEQGIKFLKFVLEMIEKLGISHSA